MADITPESEAVRGAQARELLEHPLLREFLGHVRSSLERERAKCGIRDTELHTRLILWEQCANAFERAMRQTIETGEIAKLQIAQRGMFRR